MDFPRCFVQHSRHYDHARCGRIRALAWLTPVLTAGKCLLIKFPLRCASWTKNKRAHIVCWLSFIPALLVTTSKLIIHDISFDFRAYVCTDSYNANIWKTIMPILTFIALILPNSILIATTIPTLKYLYTVSKSARRVQGSIPWQGAVIVSLTAIVYCISFLPTTIHNVVASFVQTKFFEVHLYRIAYFIISISVMSNIYIYTLAIKSFRRFIFSRIFHLDRFNVISNSAEGGTITGKCLQVNLFY